MGYQVLARKYRPQRFSDVIGQDHVTQTLLNALAQDRIAHGYIFSGHRGIGKTTIARILAMALQCRKSIGAPERPTPEPCGTCDACTEIRAGNAMDVIEIDAATNRGIDEIRELREGARYSPARDKYKIYILDEAHQITDAAFNALLKTLEEPPAHVIFMMATTQPEDIPQTIRSRCQHFSFHAVRFQEIVEQLRSIASSESVAVDEGALSLLAEAGDGSMRDALSIMDQAIASAPLINGKHALEAGQIRSLMGTVSNQIFEDMMQAVHENNAASMLDKAANLLDAGNSPQQIARQMVRFLRNCLMARIAGAKSELLQISEDERTRGERIAAIFSEEDLTRFLNSMLRTFDDLGYRQEQRFHLELGLLKIVHMQRLLPFEELFRQLSSSIAPGNSVGPGGGNVGRPTQRGNIRGPSVAAVSPASTRVAPTLPLSGGKELNPTAAPKQALHPLDGVFARSSNPVPGNGPTATSNPPEPPAISSDWTTPKHIEEKPVPKSVAAEQAEPVEIEQQSVPAVDEPEPEIPSEPAAAPLTPQATVAPETFTVDSEALRMQISAAMMQGGHETAGSLFEAGTWEWNGAELRIRIGASKTLLGLIYTTQAQQIVRDIFRKITGSSRTVRVEPAEPGAIPANGPSNRAGATIAAEDGQPLDQPQNHPLIRHAQKLFQAEVRSVVSLRNPR